MKKIILSTLLALFLAGSAFAKTPPEVLKPYKAYMAALEAGQQDKALKHSRLAWEAAETLIGDSSTTGNLAQNYADLQSYKDFDEAIRAYKRAVALAVEETEDDKSIKLERLIKLSEMYIATPDYKKAKKYVAEAKALIQSTNLQRSTFGGEIKVLSGWLAGTGRGRNTKRALSEFDEAIEIFKSPSEEYDSVFPYLVHIYKGDVLRNSGKPIQAALEYQIIMQNLKGTLSENHPFVRTALNKWLFMRQKINENGKTEDALRAGVCKCWPYDEVSSNTSLPIKRERVKMHSSMRKSGHASFKFDLNEAGSPINIEVVNATDKVFIRPSRVALKKWKYEPLSADHTAKSRKGLVTIFRFNVHDFMSGKLIADPKVIADLKNNADVRPGHH